MPVAATTTTTVVAEAIEEAPELPIPLTWPVGLLDWPGDRRATNYCFATTTNKIIVRECLPHVIVVAIEEKLSLFS